MTGKVDNVTTITTFEGCNVKQDVFGIKISKSIKRQKHCKWVAPNSGKWAWLGEDYFVVDSEHE
jgi:hypothetical protein